MRPRNKLAVLSLSRLDLRTAAVSAHAAMLQDLEVSSESSDDAGFNMADVNAFNS